MSKVKKVDRSKELNQEIEQITAKMPDGLKNWDQRKAADFKMALKAAHEALKQPEEKKAAAIKNLYVFYRE